MKIVCPKCQQFLKCERNSVLVLEMMSLADGGEEPYRLWHADLWKCRTCGAEAIVGFGKEPVVENQGQADFTARVQAEKASTDLMGRTMPCYEVR